ncbi:MAG: DinB family protein [Bacteroidota bacterium]
MTIDTAEFYRQYELLGKNLLGRIERISREDSIILNMKSASDRWSPMECIKHLNLCGEFYLPETENVLSKSPKGSHPIFKPGWLGNYFVEAIRPKAKLNKMKTFKAMTPNEIRFGKECTDLALVQMKRWLDLLEKSKEYNLSKISVATALSPFIKMRLGDIIRFNFHHIERHLVQAENEWKAIESELV